MNRASVGTRTVLLAASLLLAGCDREEGRATPAVHVDTTNTDALDGLSNEQVEAKAEALTPEQAAARGIVVDSSIHVENLSGPDSVRLAPDSPAVSPPDSTPVSAPRP